MGELAYERERLMFYSVFNNSRAFKCVDANFIFSQKNDVTLTCRDVMTRCHGKSRLPPFRAENIFRKSYQRNFGCWSSCLSNRQKCALGVILPPPPPLLGRGRVNKLFSIRKLKISSLIMDSINLQHIHVKLIDL